MEEQDSRSYLAQKVHPIFEKILIELLITKPEDPVEFMSNWLQTTGQQYRPAEKQNVPFQAIPEHAAPLNQFSSTLPVQHTQIQPPNSQRKSQLQSLQNPVLNRQQSNQVVQQSQQLSSNQHLSHQISGQPINSQFEIQINSQNQIHQEFIKQGLDQSEINQKSFENSQEDLDNQLQQQNMKLIPHDQPSPSPIEPKKGTFPLNKQQSVLNKPNQGLSMQNNKTLKKSITQTNQQLFQQPQQKPPQIQLQINNTPRDQSLAQMKSSQGNSNQQSALRQNLPSRDEHEQLEVNNQQLNSLSASKELQSKQSAQQLLLQQQQQQQSQQASIQQQQQQQQQQSQIQQQQQANQQSQQNALSGNQSQINSQIDKKNFKVFPKNKDQKQRVLKKMSQSFFFQHLNDQQKEIVAQAMEEKKLKPNEIIIKQGDDGHQMYLVDQGLLDCYKKVKPNNEEKFVKSYHPGDLFGEMALLYNEKRAATITAKTDCVLWALDQETFDAFIKESALNKRQTFDAILQKFDILEHIDTYMRLQIADALTVYNFNAKEIVFREGDKGDNFYLIQSGKIKALKLEGENDYDKQQREVYEFTQYDYLGELAMLKEQPRQATIVCETNAVLLGLDRQSFKKLLQPIHELLKRNSERYQNFSFY